MAQDHDGKAEEQPRRYDKGERRRKHVSNGTEPEIEFVPGSPKMWIGKCPRTLTHDDHVRLVNEAIPGKNGDREVSFQKKLYVVHDGTIYEVQTTDRGRSYHGYPYKGKLGRGLVKELRKMAVSKNCQAKFESWVKEHIEEHGK